MTLRRTLTDEGYEHLMEFINDQAPEAILAEEYSDFLEILSLEAFEMGFNAGQQAAQIDAIEQAEARDISARHRDRGEFQLLTMRFGGDNVTMMRAAWDHLRDALPYDHDDRRRIASMLATEGWR